MIEIEKVAENIWCFPVVLPDNPLKWLNCYVIKGGAGERSLLIDTGFNRPECLEALVEGMKALEIDPAMTDVFLTHLHSDHTGNAKPLQDLGCRIIMGESDYNRLMHGHRDSWVIMRDLFIREGVTPEMAELIFENNPGRKFSPERFDAQLVNDGDVLSYGGYKLRCVVTPGHTPGHVCLYEEEKKIMFLGDHVLFTITPNITYWLNVEDSLGDYINNLKRIREYDVELALPAHRQRTGITMRQRIDELLSHHERRLTDTERIIREQQGQTGYEVAGKMKWKIRADTWDTFPPAQKWFAMGEAISHLDYLERRGRIERRFDGENIRYYIPEGK